MSEVDGEVEGGLDEPADLQPDPGTLALASAEDDWSRADWEKAAAHVLRRARRLDADDPDDAVWTALAHTTYDGVGVTPLGTSDLLDGLATSGRPGRAGPWDIRTPLTVTDAARANEALLADLENGATSLWLTVPPDTDLSSLLEGVLLDLAPVTLDAPGWQATAARSLAELYDRYDGAPAPGTNLGADPVGARVRGNPADDADLVAIARLALERGVLGVVVDATAVHELGGSDAQEVGYALATGAAYLRILTGAGIDLDAAVGLLEFRFAATDEQFATIAKLRAARRCWSRVLELSEVSTASTGGSLAQRQHVVTSRPMMSVFDPWVNMLRTTVAAFAAGAGGADAITVVPFDSPLGEPDAFGRRIARNTSSLLISESHAAAVADPAGGAYAVERLTDDMAGAAWQELDRIEESVGIHAALEDGSFLGRVREVAERRDRDVATRKRPITGLSEFPNLGETLPERVASGAPEVRRYGAAFEALRAEPPTSHVFLATLGQVAAHTRRAGFAANLLAAGGIAVDVAGATSGVDDLVAAYAGQSVACLAGTDAAYAEWGADAAAALRAGGAEWVVIAGVSTGSTAGFTWADDSCAVGVDAVAFLTRTREHLS